MLIRFGELFASCILLALVWRPLAVSCGRLLPVLIGWLAPTLSLMLGTLRLSCSLILVTKNPRDRPRGWMFIASPLSSAGLFRYPGCVLCRAVCAPRRVAYPFEWNCLSDW